MNKQTHRVSAGPTVMLPHDQKDQTVTGWGRLPNGGIVLFVSTQAFEKKKARLAYLD